jgi:hypothetical protein
MARPKHSFCLSPADSLWAGLSARSLKPICLMTCSIPSDVIDDETALRWLRKEIANKQVEIKKLIKVLIIYYKKKKKQKKYKFIEAIPNLTVKLKQKQIN